MSSIAFLDSFFERNYSYPVYLSDLHRDTEREKRAIAQEVRILRRRA